MAATAATSPGYAEQQPGVEAAAARSRSLLVEAGVVAGLTALAVVAYVVTDAPLYNPAWSVDPWLYTALWTNFHQIYSVFMDTYYASRIPWIAPGYFLNALLDARPAALVLHGVFFFGGAACVYFLTRRFFGWIPAAISFIALAGSQMYFSAHRWDYQEGAVVTYLAAAVYFATPLVQDRRRRALSLVGGGFFAAALVTTQIFALVFLLGLPLFYLVGLGELPRPAWLRRVLEDAAAFVVGGGVLLVACGLFAVAHGGRFAFFMPQIDTALHAETSQNRQAIDVWLPREPRFFVPVFVVALAGLVLASKRLDRIPQRALAAAALWTAGDFLLLCYWDFVGEGFFFPYIWYFSPFLVGLAVCLAGTSAGLTDIRDRLTLRTGVVLGAATVGVLAPLVWLFGDDIHTRFADDVGYEQYVAMGVLMDAALFAAVAAIMVPRLRAVMGVATVALSLLAASYGLDASLGTYLDGASDPITGEVYDLGQDLIDHLHDEGLDEGPVNFWYDQNALLSVPRGIQSLYYFSYSYVGISLPKIDDDFRHRMVMYKPKRIVLMCERRGCGNGPEALRRAGYAPRLESRERLAEGSLALWVEIYGVDPPAS
jgi:hypothetical protein